MSLLNITNFLPHSFLQETSLHHNLGEEISLCENGNMIFHWADFDETCDVIRAQMESNVNLKEDFENRERALAQLSLIPVWFRTSTNVQQTTMYNVYERYILNKSQIVTNLDPFSSTEVSFISGTGPFKLMSISECLNPTTYKDFVLVSLLRGKLPKRDFRVRLKAKVLAEFGANFQKATLINLDQLTTRGLLLSMDSDLYSRYMIQEGKIRLLLDTKVLTDSLGKTLLDLSEHLQQYPFNLLYSSRKEDAIELAVTAFKVQSSFDFLKNKKSYLFVPYTALKASHPLSERAINEFVSYTRRLVRNHYQATATEFSA